MANAPKKSPAAKKAAAKKRSTAERSAAAQEADATKRPPAPMPVDLNRVTYDENIRAQEKIAELGWDPTQLLRGQFEKVYTWAVLVTEFPDLTWEDMGDLVVSDYSQMYSELLAKG